MVISNEIYEQALKNHDNMMIMHSAGSRFMSALDVDEIHSCKLTALWKALQKWKADHGSKFTGFLYQQVRWECLKHINHNNKNKDVQAEHVDREVLPDTPLYELLDCLPPEQRDIVEKRYVYGMTYREIGDEYGCCYETIRKKLKKALDHMKTVLQA